MAAKRKALCVDSDNNFVANGYGNNSKRRNCDKEQFEMWDEEQVCTFLEENDIDAGTVGIFIDQHIDGRVLSMLTEERMETMGIDTMGTRLKVLQVLNQLTKDSERLPEIDTTTAFYDNPKVFNDSIHGHIELHPLCVKIIDTPQFQRLRYLRQLGGTYFVFPGASHNRFEHSLGVSYLAGRLVNTLRSRQQELKITDADCLCVQIAGLCHDLGHGPFSHMFDGTFIPKAEPNTSWRHEDASVEMFEYLLEDNDLIDEFKKYGLTERDITFIKEQVAGPLNTNKFKTDWPYSGRGLEKSFLYEVVANKRNGIDVDKWDYFARDCHHLGIKNGFDHERFLKFARVIRVGGQLQICTRDKEVQNVYDMFWTRQCLHRRAYQHPVGNIVENMIAEAFLKANDHMRISGRNGKPMKISETIHDMVAYVQLNDGLFHRILHSTQPELEESRRILRNVEKRNLYKCIGQTQPEGTTISRGQVAEMREEIATAVIVDDLKDNPFSTNDLELLEAEDFVVDIVNLDYGMKKENPVEKVRFYSKSDPEKPIQFRKDEISQMLPNTFAEQHIRVYCKKTDSVSLFIAKKSFYKWCELRKDMKPPKGGDNFAMELTPLKQSQSSQDSNQGSQGFKASTVKSKLPF